VREDEIAMFLRELLNSSKVAELSLKSVPTLAATDTVSDAAQQMRQHSHGSALICRDGKLVGVFTERDLMRFLASNRSMETPLVDVMTAEPRTIQSEDTLLTVIGLMDQGGYRRLPVVDEAGVPAGIVDVKSVVHFLVEHFPSGVYNQSSHAQQTAKAREGA